MYWDFFFGGGGFSFKIFWHKGTEIHCASDNDAQELYNGSMRAILVARGGVQSTGREEQLFLRSAGIKFTYKAALSVAAITESLKVVAMQASSGIIVCLCTAYIVLCH